MDTALWITVFFAAFFLLVTIIGWIVTSREQTKLAQTQGGIQKSISEHDTRFNYLHQRQGQILAELYKRMVWMEGLFHASARLGRLKNEELPEDQIPKALKEYNNLIVFYKENRLFIDLDLCKKIEDLLKKVLSISINVGIFSERHDQVSDLRQVYPVDLFDVRGAEQLGRVMASLYGRIIGVNTLLIDPNGPPVIFVVGPSHSG